MSAGYVSVFCQNLGITTSLQKIILILEIDSDLTTAIFLK